MPLKGLHADLLSIPFIKQHNAPFQLIYVALKVQLLTQSYFSMAEALRLVN